MKEEEFISAYYCFNCNTRSYALERKISLKECMKCGTLVEPYYSDKANSFTDEKAELEFEKLIRKMTEAS